MIKTNISFETCEGFESFGGFLKKKRWDCWNNNSKRWFYCRNAPDGYRYNQVSAPCRAHKKKHLWPNQIVHRCMVTSL